MGKLTGNLGGHMSSENNILILGIFCVKCFGFGFIDSKIFET
jgi:hypothetical protein